MFCTNCGAEIKAGDKYCGACGKLLENTCPTCKTVNKPGASFCTNCGASLSSTSQTAAPVGTSKAIFNDLKELAPGETQIMDTGHFPVSYIKNVMTSVNGHLYLTNMRIIFKAVALQGVGGISSGALFTPNPKDGDKAKMNFGIPLSEVTAAKSGWSTLNISASEEYKFGAVRKPKEWADAIERAIGQR